MVSMIYLGLYNKFLFFKIIMSKGSRTEYWCQWFYYLHKPTLLLRKAALVIFIATMPWDYLK